MRARYRKTAEEWQQSILRDVPHSYSFEVHEMDEEARIRNLAAARHGELDICKSPVFTAAVFDLHSGEQKLLLLLLVAHHLVVDLMS